MTMLNGLAIITGVFVLNGLISRSLGIDALGEFLLVRRTALTILGVFLLGMSIGLPYYIAQGEDKSYGASGLMLFMILTVPFIGLVSAALRRGVLSGFPPEFALPFFLFTAAYALQALAYGLLRGHLNMLGANLLQLLGTGLIPIGAFILFRDQGIVPILLATGVGTFFVSGFVYFRKMGLGYYALDRSKTQRLLTYGIQRVPSFLAQFILLAGVPLLILPDSSKAEIAYFISGLSLLRLFLVVVGPLGIILLPWLSKAMTAGEEAPMAQNLDVLGKAVLLIAVPLALFLSMNSSIILTIWLGSGSEAGARIVQLVVLALPFYLLMEVLRSPIDAGSTKGYNSVIYGLAALALLIFFYGLKNLGLASVAAGVISFIAAQVTAAVASLYYSHKFYGINVLSPGYLLTILGAMAFSSLFFYVVGAFASGLGAFLIGGTALVSASGLYFARARSEWVVELRSLVFER